VLTEVYSDETKQHLGFDIASERKAIFETETAINGLTTKISMVNSKRNRIKTSILKQEVESADARTMELQNMLRHLKRLGNELMSDHKRLLDARNELGTEIKATGKNLQIVQHIKERRNGEIHKLASRERIQLAALRDELKHEKIRETQRKQENRVNNLPTHNEHLLSMNNRANSDRDQTLATF
jgi:hypothetical protein